MAVRKESPLAIGIPHRRIHTVILQSKQAVLSSQLSKFTELPYGVRPRFTVLAQVFWMNEQGYNPWAVYIAASTKSIAFKTLRFACTGNKAIEDLSAFEIRPSLRFRLIIVTSSSALSLSFPLAFPPCGNGQSRGIGLI